MPASTKSSQRGVPAKKSKSAKRPAPAPALRAAEGGWISEHADLVWTAGLAIVSAVLFLTTFSSDVQFGDSAESVAAVKSLGIVHAPGYVSYIVAAKLFTIVEPFGSLAFRVNLFGVVCSAAAVALTFRICRRLGVTRLGAAFGAITLATGVSVWFYATYAKAYSITVLILAAVLLLLLAWREDGRPWRLYVAGALVGIGAGAAYQVILLALPGFLVLVFGRARRPSGRELVTGVAVSGLAAASVLGFVLVRAQQEPAVNWGDAASVSRLVDLYRMSDFGFGSRQLGGGRVGVGSSSSSSGAGSTTSASSSSGATSTTQGSTTTTAPSDSAVNRQQAPGVGNTSGTASLHGAFGRFLVAPFRVLTFPLWASTDVGVVAAILGALGAVLLFTRRMSARWGLAVIVAGNIVGAGVVVAGTRFSLTPPTADRVLGLGGFYLAATLVFALFAGIGAGAVVEWAGAAATSQQSRAARRRRDRTGARWSWRPVVIGIFGLAVVVTAVLHYPDANNRTTNYATDYARNIFASLPDNAVLFTFDAQRAFVLEEQQIVDDVRPDVDIVRFEQMGRPWYREQLSKKLGVSLGPAKQNFVAEAADLATMLRSTRPVYLDNAASYYINQVVPDFGFKQLGLVAEAVDGKGAQGADLPRMDQLFGVYRYSALGAGAVRRFPNETPMLQYVYAFLDYGSALGKAGRYDEAIEVFRKALQIDPGNVDVRKNLQLAREKQAQG